ncbi:MAG: hypothetical protein V3U84_04470 [Thiotrichaceae bacterium]
MIPEGNLLHLYECKWHDASGEMPKNIHKILPVFGEDNIRQITTLTTVPQKIRINENFSVSNVVEL